MLPPRQQMGSRFDFDFGPATSDSRTWPSPTARSPVQLAVARQGSAESNFNNFEDHAATATCAQAVADVLVGQWVHLRLSSAALDHLIGPGAPEPRDWFAAAYKFQ
mmetsp:Transcript_116731/g.293593  ORF Transcript_116731/g.293593 Transcript_116731/m.293593 type:complete len:106 (-) Transcript_116731:52-369(-)